MNVINILSILFFHGFSSPNHGTDGFIFEKNIDLQVGKKNS